MRRSGWARTPIVAPPGAGWRTCCGENSNSAWRESDAIRRRGAPDPHRFWNGEDIRGKRVIVRCLHGFGDAVQFLRYAPALRALAANVMFEVAPRFVELARCFDGVDHVITWGEDAPVNRPNGTSRWK